MTLRVKGLAAQEIMQALGNFRQHDVAWRNGKLMAGLYDPGQAVEEVSKAAYLQFLTENALYPNYFPSLLQLENEIVRSIAELLNGTSEVVGNCTSGGTESIILAVKAARDKARAERPEVTQPEMIVPQTAHAAFHKAAHYLGLKLVVTPFDLSTFQADYSALEAAITPNTILLVASAPCYSHGVIDPISQIGAIALKHNLLFHVDACVGGLHLAFMRKLGYAIPDFDFAVPGVTSLSVDLHKYGYAVKNASVILFHNRQLRRYAYFANATTTGYSVLNTTVLSSKSGGPLAGAWATLQAFGEEGYKEVVQEVMRATQRVLEGIRAIPELRVLGQPAMCMFTLASDTISVFELEDEMVKHGWFLQPQFSAGGGPANIHLSFHRGNVPHVEEFLSDLKTSVAALKTRGSLADIQELRQEVLKLLQAPGADTFGKLLELAGIAPGQMPQSFARINTVLDALPDSLVETLLVEYLNTLYA